MYTECHHNSREFSVKPTITGKIIVMVRYAEADISPDTWAFGKWRYADQNELAEVLGKLSELNR